MINEMVRNTPNNKEVIRNFYQFVVKEIPDGIHGDELSYPVLIAGHDLNVVIYGLHDERVSIGLRVREGLRPKDDSEHAEAMRRPFKAGHYSRKTLEISKNGEVREDPIGTLPDFDLTDNEPDFSGLSDEDIAADVIRQIRAFKKSSLN